MINLNPEVGSPLERIAAFMLANLLWVVFSVPIITLPAATAGLFAVFAPWVRGKHSELFATFFSAMRRFWFKSSLIVIIDVALVALVLFNLRVLDLMGTGNPMTFVVSAVTLFVGLVVLLTNLYLWPLLVMFDLRLPRLFNISVRLAFGHSLWSLFVLGIAALPVAISLILPQLFLMFFTFAATASLVLWGTWRIIEQYTTPEELAELDKSG